MIPSGISPAIVAMSKHSTAKSGFRWTCPYCGASRLNRSPDDDGSSNAVVALRTHVQASDGAEHGPKNEFPGSFSDLTLADHVVPAGQGASGR